MLAGKWWWLVLNATNAERGQTVTICDLSLELCFFIGTVCDPQLGDDLSLSCITALLLSEHFARGIIWRLNWNTSGTKKRDCHYLWYITQASKWDHFASGERLGRHQSIFQCIGTLSALYWRYPIPSIHPSEIWEGVTFSRELRRRLLPKLNQLPLSFLACQTLQILPAWPPPLHTSPWIKPSRPM